MSISTTPAFNLKVVVNETGIAPDTLRAWERRYGLPMPDRTPGGHRLYSQRDIEIIKWLLSKQEEGLSISRAVGLWKELTTSGQDPISESLVEITPVIQTAAASGTNLESLRAAWLEACMDFNESAADQLLNQAFAMVPLETVCVELLQKGLFEIGEMWYHSAATVQQEHFTSALAHRRLDALIAAAPPPTRPQTVLIGCTPGEQHTFTALLLTLLLRRRGLKVVYLGANVPVQRFDQTVSTVRPQLVILSAQLLQTAKGLWETSKQLEASRTQVAYGGRIFNIAPELRQKIPAHFLGASIQEALVSVETLLNSSIPLESVEEISQRDASLHRSFLDNRARIVDFALDEVLKTGLSSQFAAIAVNQLGENLDSALSFGEIHVLENEMDWIAGLLHEHNHSLEQLTVFLNAYAKAVDSVMGNEGQPISSWIRSQAN